MNMESCHQAYRSDKKKKVILNDISSNKSHQISHSFQTIFFFNTKKQILKLSRKTKRRTIMNEWIYNKQVKNIIQ